MIDSEHMTQRARLSLAAQIAGTATFPGDPGYDAERAAWNLAVHQLPGIIIRAADAADVTTAVRYAVRSGWGVAIQATGHGIARPADNAMLLLTADLDQVTVDPAAATARVAAGAQWGAVLKKAAAHGLAPLLGSSPGVGAVGYTLGGGLGWLARKHGLSADRVASFDIVTGNGRLVRADATENADLFWALRGAGAGSLGVVTAMEIDLIPLDMVYGGNLFYPAADAEAVAARYAEWITRVPEELTSSLVLMNFPPLDAVPGPLRGRSFVIVRGCHIGSPADAEKELTFWRAWKAPEIDLFGALPFSAVGTISNDPAGPIASAGSTDWLSNLGEDVVAALIEHTFGDRQGPPFAFVEVRHVGGAVSRPPQQAAFGNREASLLLGIIGAAPNPEARAALSAHIGRLRARLQPHRTGGAYLNFLDGEERVRRTREGFSLEDYRRLQEIKRKYDPDNIFRYGIDLTGG